MGGLGVFVHGTARRLAVAGLALIAFVVGVVGFVDALDPGDPLGDSFLDCAYYAVQLFVLDAAPLSENAPTNVYLAVARWLAPAATLLAVVEAIGSAFRAEWRRVRAARARGHSVVCGSGEEAVLLARALRAERRPVVLLGRGELLGAGDRQGLLVVTGAGHDRDALRAAGVGRAQEVFALEERSADNAAIALGVRELARRAGRSVRVHASLQDERVAVALRARRIGVLGDRSLYLEFFVVDEVAARVLLDQHAPPPVGNVLVVGDGAFASAVVRELRRREHEGRLLTSQDGVGGHGDTTSCPTYVCHDDPDRALSDGLARVAAGAPFVVVCLRRRAAFGDAFDERRNPPLLDAVYRRLRFFGVLDAGTRPGAVRDDVVDRLARATHAHYVAARLSQGDDPLRNASLRPWLQLPDALKKSNYAQARHIGVKLDRIHATVVPEVPEGTGFAFRPGEIDTLAQLEHVRWVAERRAQGFVHGSERSGRFHPDLVDWNDLDDEAKRKDREVVTGLPALLASVGLAILRVEDGVEP